MSTNRLTGAAGCRARPAAWTDVRGVRVKRRHAPSGRSALPNILVYIDARDGLPTAPTLFALSEARRIARLGGASIFGVLVTAPLATSELERLAAPIGEAGADKLLLCERDDFAGAPDDATHGRALDAAVARVPPMLVLFPAGGAGVALGPPLAARLGGAFAPWCDFVTSDAEVPAPAGTGRVQLVHFRPDGRSCRRLDPIDIERPIVATLGAGRRPPPQGSLRDLEVDVVPSLGKRARPVTVERSRAPNPHAAFELASVLVLIGDDSDAQPLVPPGELSRGLPPGTAVARVSDVPASVLAKCCPDVLLRIGASPTQVARSPRTRVVLALPIARTDTAPEAAADDVDVLWQFPSPAHLTAQAVGALLAEIGDTA
ncbi:MAG: hypothetical protein ABUR63_07625 [Verrucomicrobiota bacterium]